MRYAIILLLSILPFNDVMNINVSIVEDYNLYQGVLDIEPVITAKRYSTKEIDAVEHCVCGEAEGESLEGKIAVVNIIQNRMLKKNKGILEIIYRPNQFDGMKSNRPITEECKKAVRMALFDDVKVIPSDVVYFHNKVIATGSGWIKKLENQKLRWGQIGKHEFYSYKDKKDVP